jgi:hypothetical protein
MLEMVDMGATARSSVTMYIMLPCTNPPGVRPPGRSGRRRRRGARHPTAAGGTAGRRSASRLAPGWAKERWRFTTLR